jgi:hypothetical protein
MSDKRLSLDALQQFHGSENLYRHFSKNLIYTDGIKFLAEQAGCYWLIDEIAFSLPKLLKKNKSWFYAIDFKVSKRKSARIIFTDGNDVQILRKHILWTDFPLVGEKITLFLAEGEIGYCLMLPGEY